MRHVIRKYAVSLLTAAVLPYGGHAQRIQQTLGRSVVAVASENNPGQVLVSWRKLAQEPEDCRYNLYKRAQGSAEYTMVNSEPVDRTNFQTTLTEVPFGTELAVTTVTGGVESDKSSPFLFRQHSFNNLFFEFDFDNNVLHSDNYRTDFVWPMDLNGTGEFDALLVSRIHVSDDTPDPNCTTDTRKLQAYKLDGTLLWTMDVGPNQIYLDCVVAYDINCDGKCEVIVKTSDGSRMWDAEKNDWGKYANGSDSPDVDGDGIVDYRGTAASGQHTYNPPFYISVLDGTTGKEIACSELNYAEVKDGVGDEYARDNRADYFDDGEGTEYAFMGGKFSICYFDGIHPSLVMEALDRRVDSGHHYYVFEWKFDWTGGKPSNWHHAYTWSRNDKTPWPAEFHQLRVADVDGDGIDEMVDGGFAVNSTKGMVMSAGIGHGDRFRVSDIDPDRPGMEVYAIQQGNILGQLLYDAATGEHIKEWYLSSIGDVGRGECMDVDPDHKGYEIYSTMPNLYDCKGNVIKEGDAGYPFEGVWWDGDLQREILASHGSSGYDINMYVGSYRNGRLLEMTKRSGYAVHGINAARPAYFGDMTGDWREEIILLKQGSGHSTGIVGYSTDIPTDYSMYTLQEDPHYRLDCTTRFYYQSPNTSFYLGGDMPYPPLPPVMVTDLRWQGGALWAAGGSGFTSFGMTAAENYADGKSVVFDISGDNSQTILLSGAVRPSAVYMMPSKGHDYTFGGSGTLSGAMELWKSMQGTATFNNSLEYTGRTVISEGTLCVNGRIAGPVDLRAKGTLSGVAEVGGGITFEGALNYEGCRLMPGNAADRFGVMTFAGSLTLPGNVYVECAAADGKAASIMVNGDLTLDSINTFTVSPVGGAIAEGSYVLAGCTGTLTADVSKIKVRGLEGVNYDVTLQDRQIVLVVNPARAPQKGVVWTGGESGVWDYKADNFKAGGEATAFVVDDEVVFGDEASTRDITLNEKMITGGAVFDFDGSRYTLTGDGGIGGTGGLTKSGRGELRIELQNSDYTGPTVLNGGTLTVTNLSDGGKPGALGAPAAGDGNLVLNGGTLRTDGVSMATDRTILVSDTAVIDVAKTNGSLTLKGIVKGDGYLVKDGPGQLTFMYEGENPFAGIILRQGKLATGAWNSTFGRIGGNMLMAGGTVDLIDIKDYDRMPQFNYVTTVEEGTDNTLMGTVRGQIMGSFMGKGRLTIVSDGVRNDIGSDFSAFEGTLTAQGANFRLLNSAVDMAKADVVLAEGAYVSNVSGSPEPVRIGSLASKAADCTLGGSTSAYEVGYNGHEASFAGVLAAKSVTKCGDGVWTITSGGSSSDVTVTGGVLQLYNNPFSLEPTAFTLGSVIVRDGGTLTGTGSANKVTVNTGGTLAAGYDGGYGTLKAAGMVTMFNGSTIVVKVGKSSLGSDVNDKFNFSGKLYHTGDTLVVRVAPGRELSVGDEIAIFTGKGGQSGKPAVIRTECDGRRIEWDDTELQSKGILRVAAVTGMAAVTGDDTEVDVYTVDGIMVRGGVRHGEALDGLAPGTYIVNGVKTVRKAY